MSRTMTNLSMRTPEAGDLLERRAEPRQRTCGDLWMIDPDDSTVFRCRCVDLSESGLRLRAPLGYGIRKGRRYELCSHLHDRTHGPQLGFAVSRWATVVRSRMLPDETDDCVDVGLRLDHSRRTATSPFTLLAPSGRV